MKLALSVLILTFMSISDTSALKTSIRCATCYEESVGVNQWAETCKPSTEHSIGCGGDVGSPVGFCRTEFSEANVVVDRYCAHPGNFKFQKIENGCYRAKFNDRFQNTTVLKKTCFCDTDKCNIVTTYDGV